MSVTEKESSVGHRNWGDGDVVIHDDSSTGAWIKYDPEDPLLNLDNWR